MHVTVDWPLSSRWASSGHEVLHRGWQRVGRTQLLDELVGVHGGDGRGRRPCGRVSWSLEGGDLSGGHEQDGVETGRMGACGWGTDALTLHLCRSPCIPLNDERTACVFLQWSAVLQYSIRIPIRYARKFKFRARIKRSLSLLKSILQFGLMNLG